VVKTGNEVPNKKRLAAIRRRLLGWYGRARRVLPWRGTRDPYAIWVSEVMLQQTRVEAVVEPYARFLARFPDLRSLAAASEGTVLDAWAGLGYYRRARNLHRAVRVCAAEHEGRVPSDPVAFRALPGVGAYTAGAVLSIAFDEPLPAVDGNVIRVLARLFAIDGLVTRQPASGRIRALAAALVPRRPRQRGATRRPAGGCGSSNRGDEESRTADASGPRAWTQALMELGALVCVPRAPACDRCPLATLCAAHRDGREAGLPVRATPRAREEVEVSVAAVLRRGSVLLVRRPSKGLLAGMWSLPTLEGAGPDGLADALGAPVREEVAAWKHVFTHRVWHARLFRVGSRLGQPPRQLRWVPLPALLAAPLPSAYAPAVQALVLASTSR